MIPLQELLSRIHWDQEFGQGEFTLGYNDHVTDKMVIVPLRTLHIDPDDHFAFQLTDADGETRPIPFHRVKEVYKDGKLIWRRTH